MTDQEPEETTAEAPAKVTKKRTVKKKAEEAKVAIGVRCDYCRAIHTEILEPGGIGDTTMSLHERELMKTKIPLDKLLTNRAICPECGTKVPLRIRYDESTCFLSRQGVK